MAYCILRGWTHLTRWGAEPHGRENVLEEGVVRREPPRRLLGLEGDISKSLTYVTAHRQQGGKAEWKGNSEPAAACTHMDAQTCTRIARRSKGESLSIQTPLPQKEAQGPEDSLEGLRWAPFLSPLDLTPYGQVGLRPLKPPFLYALSERVSLDFQGSRKLGVHSRHDNANLPCIWLGRVQLEFKPRAVWWRWRLGSEALSSDCPKPQC